MSVIAIIGALDTKGAEFAFLKGQIEKRGHKTLTIDMGILEPPKFKPDVSRDDVAAAGGIDLAALAAAKDRGQSVAAMTKAAEAIALKLHGEGKFDAIIGMGGTAGSAMCSAAMRALPLGVPKVLVSTVAGTDVSGYVGVKDIVMIPSIVDVSGINSISGQVIAQAAGAVVGMVETEIPKSEGKPLICASMFGNTTDCVEAARKIIEGAGYEVLVFHAVGTGGRTMESLIEAGYISGVLDVTTTEWADELVGGVLTAGPTRMEAAAKCGVPAIVVPGCLDMVNFWAPDTIPAKFKGRKFYEHNSNITLMRTTPEECEQLGKIFAEKVNMSSAPVEVFIPLKGISVIAAPDQPFYWPEADEALFGAIKSNLRDDIPVRELDVNINDAEFSKAVADALLNVLK
jgi:uncharacterized protein (UPF0261 family)